MTRPPNRIAILGGGPAAMATAWALTSVPDWQSKYEITLYTQGWRLGGKVATGRGRSARIEEHGIHILQGWYHNSFRMLRSVFHERAEKGIDPDAPWHTIEASLDKETSTLMTERRDPTDPWESWQLEFPENRFIPGEGEPLSDYERAVKLLKVGLVLGLGAPHPDAGRLRRAIAPLFRRVTSDDPGTEMAGNIPNWLRAWAMRTLRTLSTRLPSGPGWLVQAGVLRTRGKAQRLAIAADLGLCITRGMLQDVYVPESDVFDFEQINHLDFRAWLRQHGAMPETLQSPLVRFAYTGTFATGSGAAQNKVAAGTALQFGTMALGYKGAFVYKFKAGTGDTILTPWYQVLVDRGVRFEFFHRVQQVHRTEDGSVDRVVLQRQVDLNGGDIYDPLVQIGNLKCWPATPILDQISPEQASLLEQPGADLESPWFSLPSRPEITLKHGEDFDDVVLAIPVAALPAICDDLIEADPRWANMVSGIRTTCTQSVQLWLDRPVEDLGFDRPSLDMKPTAEANLVTFEEPLYSWLDMSSLLPFERWEQDKAKCIAYFTGPLPDPQEPVDPAQEHDDLRERTRDWLDAQIGAFWPKVVQDGVFDTSTLVGSDPGAAYPQQFFKANIEPTARYTLAYPGTNGVRMRASESGLDNLYLAGDWTDYGLNVGYIDGAVTSGLQCAKAYLANQDIAWPLRGYWGLDRPARA